jgi:hypothetical protein
MVPPWFFLAWFFLAWFFLAWFFLAWFLLVRCRLARRRLGGPSYFSQPAGLCARQCPHRHIAVHYVLETACLPKPCKIVAQTP